MTILQADDAILQVWIRALTDTNDCPLSGQIYFVGDLPYRLLKQDHDTWPSGIWHGFSFNPGLRRTREYRLVGSYGSLDRCGDMSNIEIESAVSQVYRDCGFRAAILADNGGRGYIRHLGEGRHLADPVLLGEAGLPGDNETRSLMHRLDRPPFTLMLPYCGQESKPGKDEIEEWQIWTHQATTTDQMRIEEYLEDRVTSDSSILHIGIGNSSLAK